MYYNFKSILREFKAPFVKLKIQLIYFNVFWDLVST